MTIETLGEHACFGGVQGFYRHASIATRSSMKFGVFVPPQATNGSVPVLFYLAGLTCSEETFAIKAGAQQHAAAHGLMLVTPDTSPRDTGVRGKDAAWGFGTAVGFYLDASQDPWNRHWHTESYIVRELRALECADGLDLVGAHRFASRVDSEDAMRRACECARRLQPEA